jgi:putative hydrolase of the HAD superfamily
LINIKYKIIIFDLDDTLYDSRIFTFQGFWSVSIFLSKITNVDKKIIYYKILSFSKKNNKRAFNMILENLNLPKKYLVKLLSIYRYSNKKLFLYEDAKYLLNFLGYKRSFLITDGNKKMQAIKIKSLKISKYFKKIFITNQYGIKNNKPSIFCFEKIRKLEKTTFNNLVYIGDNPKKDFLVKKYGITTIRLKRGIYKKIKLENKFEADYSINNLRRLVNFV